MRRWILSLQPAEAVGLIRSLLLAEANRRAALLQLGAEVPPAVLADMLNLAPSTAMKWVEWAGGNWSNYVAERIRSNTRMDEGGGALEPESTSMSYAKEGSD